MTTHHVPSAGDTQKSKATFIFQSDSVQHVSHFHYSNAVQNIIKHDGNIRVAWA